MFETVSELVAVNVVVGPVWVAVGWRERDNVFPDWVGESELDAVSVADTEPREADNEAVAEREFVDESDAEELADIVVVGDEEPPLRLVDAVMTSECVAVTRSEKVTVAVIVEQVQAG